MIERKIRLFGASFKYLQKPILISLHLPFTALRADDDLAKQKSQAIRFLFHLKTGMRADFRIEREVFATLVKRLLFF
jgi:hypothetical protein